MFKKAYKKLIIFTLLSVVQCENKYLATMVLSIKKFYKDNIKRNSLYFFRNLFCSHCSRK